MPAGGGGAERLAELTEQEEYEKPEERLEGGAEDGRAEDVQTQEVDHQRTCDRRRSHQARTGVQAVVGPGGAAMDAITNRAPVPGAAVAVSTSAASVYIARASPPPGSCLRRACRICRSRQPRRCRLQACSAEPEAVASRTIRRGWRRSQSRPIATGSATATVRGGTVQASAVMCSPAAVVINRQRTSAQPLRESLDDGSKMAALRGIGLTFASDLHMLFGP